MPELIWDAKYQDGKRAGPVRIALPFQTVETVNESAQDRQRSLDLFSSGREGEWRNRLIWGYKKRPTSKVRGQLALRDLGVPENLGQKTGPDRFARVDGHDSCTAICMAQVVVAAANPNPLETQPPEGRDDLLARNTGQAAHALIRTR